MKKWDENNEVFFEDILSPNGEDREPTVREYVYGADAPDDFWLGTRPLTDVVV